MISPVSHFNGLLAATRPATTRAREIDPTRVADSIRGGVDHNAGADARGSDGRSQDAAIIRLSREDGSPVPADTYNRSGALRNSPSRSSNTLEEKRQKKEQEREQKEAAEKTKREITEDLKERDREVKTHEQAHKSALGPYSAGGIKLEYTTGPDGGRYAMSGSVPVDLSKEEDPEATLKKAQTIRKAALAPKEPSSADRQVAARASQIAAEARVDIREEKQAVSTDEATPSSETKSAEFDSKLPSLKELRARDDEESGSLFERRPGNLRPEDKGTFLDFAA